MTTNCDILRDKGEIYMISCTETNKKYIGQVKCYKKGRYFGAEGRFKAHITLSNTPNYTGCSALYSAFKKYGIENFTIKTIHICSLDQLDYYEAKYIRQYNTLAPNGYNLKAGGVRAKWCEEAKKNLAEKFMGDKNVRYGVKLSDEIKAKIGKGNSGKIRKESVKYKMSEDKKYDKPENIGLPRYIYHYVDNCNGHEGYKIFKHPKVKKGSRIIFVSKNKTMEEKLEEAIEYLNCLNIDIDN
jgi:group I intron endonuclease